MPEECEKTDGVISVYSMEYDLAPTQPVHIKYWIGAVLRNNLLYAASKIGVGNGTLLELISRKESEEKQDNPRGFALQCAPIFIPETLQMGELFSFRLQLFGNRKNYAEAFHQAVVEMCKRGFGYPMTPMTIMSCRHCKTDFRGQNTPYKKVKIEFITPVSIYNNRAKSQSKRSSLDKQNGMPGFYFLIKSLSHRMNKLRHLYENAPLAEYDRIEEWCEQARETELEECSLRKICLQSTPRKDSTKPILFSGYVGYAVYSRVAAKYVPLLYAGMSLNVGNDTVYGLGQYRIDMQF